MSHSLDRDQTKTQHFLDQHLCPNYLKTFVSDYHLNDPTIFLQYHTQVFSAFTLLALVCENAFSILYMHRLEIFQNHYHIQNLERLPCDCMRTEMSKFATQRQEWTLIFCTHKLVISMTPTSLDGVIAYVTRMLHFVQAGQPY